MKRHKKIALCLATIILGGVVLLVALDRLAPRIINLESTKQMIQTMVSERTGGTIDYENIKPSIFPRPGITLQNVRLAVPGTAEVRARSVMLYTKVLPLLWGQVVVSKLRVKAPELALNISGLPADTEAPSSFWYVRKSIEAVIAPLSVRSPDLDVEIQDGRLDIDWDKGEKFRFTNLSTYLTSTGKVLNLRVSGSSNFSDSIELSAKMDPATLNAQGSISLGTFKPSVLIEPVSSSASAAFTDTVPDLSFTFVLSGPKLIIANLKGTMGRSSISGLNAELDMSKKEPYLDITSAALNISLAQARQALASAGVFVEHMKSLSSVDGTLDIMSAKAEGLLFKPSAWKYQLRGEARAVTLNDTHFPGTVTIASGTLDAVPGKLTFSGFSGTVLDTSLTVSGALSDYLKGPPNAEINIKGEVGGETASWMNETAKIPPELRMEHPFTIKNSTMKWSAGPTISIDAALAIINGPGIALEAVHTPAMTEIKKFHMQDDISNATIAIETEDKALHIKFTGNLKEQTVSSLLPSVQGKGWIQGDFETLISREQPIQITANGELQGGGFSIPRDTGIPLIVNTVSLSASRNVLSIKHSELNLGETWFTADGNITSSGRDVLLDLHTRTASVTWDDIEKNLPPEEKTPEGNKQTSMDAPRILGTVEVSAGAFAYERFRWSSVHAIVSINPENVRVNVPEAEICNISTPGSVTVSDGQVQLDFRGAARKQKLRKSLNCLLGENADIGGTFDFSGHITAQGKGKRLKRSMNGWVKLSARDGTIYHYPLFSRIFSIVNVLEVFKGRYDDLISKGFPYDSIRVKGDIKKGTLMVREASMDGSTMKMAGEGEVDLTNKNADLTLIVSPLRTIDAIVEKIPVIRDITDGTLISIAVKVSGKIDDPEIITLPPSAVGEGIVGMVRRLFELPFKLFEPAKSDKKQN